jgi:glyoxylase I family protein
VTNPDLPRPAAPITGLSHVQLLVSDVRASADWYRSVLGLESYVADYEEGYVALRHRGAGIVIVVTPSRESERRVGKDPRTFNQSPNASERLDHLAFAVSDEEAIRSWADHLTAMGIDHPGIVLENGNPSLQLRDPDGIAIELVARGSFPDGNPADGMPSIGHSR